MSFCPNCGNNVSDNNLFCSNCGYRISNDNEKTNNTYTQTNSMHQPYVKTPTQTLADRERASAIVWTVVACLQALTALSAFEIINWINSIFGINLGLGTLFQIGTAAWNGYGAYCSFQRVKRVQRRQQGIVHEYDTLLITSIIFIVVNILFGGIIGIAGAIFDLFNRNYALNNSQYLED